MSEYTAEPSKVLHIRNLPEECNEGDLKTLASRFGEVRRVFHLSRKHQAFIEFVSLDDSARMLAECEAMPIRVGTRVIVAQYSNKTELSPPTREYDGEGFMRERSWNVPPNSDARILLVTVTNVVYKVDVDVMYQVFSMMGTIEKIVIFNKQGKTQALVQFERTADAQAALDRFNGLNIYNGCNSLQIGFSNLSDITVKYNNERSYDFTNPNLPAGNPNESADRYDMRPVDGRPPASQGNWSAAAMDVTRGMDRMRLGGEPFLDMRMDPAGRMDPGMLADPRLDPAFSMDAARGMDPLRIPDSRSFGPLGPDVRRSPLSPGWGGDSPNGAGFGSRGLPPDTRIPMPARGAPGMDPRSLYSYDMGRDGMMGMYKSPVILVNNLDPDRVTIDALFNLFSTCGIIQKIKILYNKRDSALIQFESPDHAENARLTLNSCPLWGRNLVISTSKHDTVQANRSDIEEEGAKLFGDYSTSNIQRYRGANARNIPSIEPSKLLHISNIPLQVTEDDLKTLFADYGPVAKLKFISGRSETQTVDRKMALVELPSIQDAAEALCYTHGTVMDGMRLRISFSTSNLDSLR